MGIYRFGAFTLNTQTYELCRNGNAIQIEPQVFSVLAHLVENRDRVVSKDELVNVVWKGRIVSDATVSSRISAARRALHDTGGGQSLIRTGLWRTSVSPNSSMILRLSSTLRD